MKPTAFFVAACLLLLLIAGNIFVKSGALNSMEPDPRHVPISVLKKKLLRCEIEVEATELLYANLDYSGYIFRGRVKSFRGSKITFKDSYFEQIIQSHTPGKLPCFGFLRIQQQAPGVDLVGVILSTTQAEFRAGSNSFETKWKSFAH